MAAKRNGKTGVLTCIECGRTERFPITSPAAPVLSMCEAAGPKGWSYQIGFFTMLTGDHQTRCPACTAGVHVDANPTEMGRDPDRRQP